MGIWLGLWGIHIIYANPSDPMKGIHKIHFGKLAFTLLASLVLFNCQTSKKEDSQPRPSQMARVSKTYTSKSSEFAFDFFGRVNKAGGKDNNLFVSPLSLHIALGMALNGANGATAEEIKNTLRLSGLSLEEVNETYEFLLKELPQVDDQVTINIANSVWYNKQFAVEPAFLKRLNDSFSAKSASLDFTSTQAKDIINSWVKEKTANKIEKIINQTRGDDLLYLLNALYFKGDWKYEFKPEKTKEETFRLSANEQKTVSMMHLDTKLPTSFRTKYAAFTLPYSKGDFSMTVLLPTHADSLDALIQGFHAAEWNALQASMQEASIPIGLPKFSMEYDINLNDILKDMGMPSAFGSSADFSGMLKGTPLAISEVKQKTYVAVDEKGTEAAAVTSIGVITTSLPPSIICNRPFAFIISEKQSGAILFMGKIVNPTQLSK